MQAEEPAFPASRPYDVTVIGGGPAGLAAALAADRAGARVLLVEREGRLGGILKQCIHDGFGLLRFGEKLSGPEYAHRFVTELREAAVEVRLRSFVSAVGQNPEGPARFTLTLTGREGLETLRTRTLVLATGCRERTARQVGIHGTRPAGVFTAGQAQYYTNILGQLPVRRCVILGSGDIGLIMARRLTLEGAEVRGVYEARQTPSALPRNIAQCLEDFDIPLYTGRTVTEVFGRDRLEGVEISRVDGALRPLPGTEERLACDGLILSVGLIPENEMAERLGVPLEAATKGPICDQHAMTLVPGVFSCGNALQVNDLVDYVSESGETAGQNAALTAARMAAGGEDGGNRPLAEIAAGPGVLCAVPQRLDLSGTETETPLFFRSREERGKTLVRVRAGERELFRREYRQLRPPEMERILLPLGEAELRAGDRIGLTMEDP
ncbi:MAG: NAD(P)/FAD-dependent oxidoreductase [Spirochaetaceae bacterium]|jgi:thioredoxin reductase|nr:NAD(P)/FAD-dependent oxidoreductase [Spirochaetaceae bacterium]